MTADKPCLPGPTGLWGTGSSRGWRIFFVSLFFTVLGVSLVLLVLHSLLG